MLGEDNRGDVEVSRARRFDAAQNRRQDPELIARHEEEGQPNRGDEVGSGVARVEGDQETTGALDNQVIGARSELAQPVRKFGNGRRR